MYEYNTIRALYRQLSHSKTSLNIPKHLMKKLLKSTHLHLIECLLHYEQERKTQITHKATDQFRINTQPIICIIKIQLRIKG